MIEKLRRHLEANHICNAPVLLIKTTGVAEQILLEEHKVNKIIFSMGKTNTLRKRSN